MKGINEFETVVASYVKAANEKGKNIVLFLCENAPVNDKKGVKPFRDVMMSYSISKSHASEFIAIARLALTMADYKQFVANHTITELREMLKKNKDNGKPEKVEKDQIQEAIEILKANGYKVFDNNGVEV